MKSIDKYGEYPSSLPVLADDVLEFHAARLLLVLRLCGRNNTINGLTKLAKLDFFVRYPAFFSAACRELDFEIPPVVKGVESKMIRFHYGPWDQRYYHVLAYLESKGLINIKLNGKTYVLSLTRLGIQISNNLNEDTAFEDLSSQMRLVSSVLGSKRGTELKRLVYELFDEEIAQLPFESVIE